MVRIRLRRVGAKGQPSYRIVVADRETARGGRFIEIIGTYNPLTDPATVEIDAERAKHWLSHGAQPSDAVARLLDKAGIRVRKVVEGAAPSEAEAAAAA
jgi:small subunit ribosomal protein S16